MSQRERDRLQAAGEGHLRQVEAVRRLWLSVRQVWRLERQVEGSMQPRHRRAEPNDSWRWWPAARNANACSERPLAEIPLFEYTGQSCHV
jgi:hypothetical protein